MPKLPVVITLMKNNLFSILLIWTTVLVLGFAIGCGQVQMKVPPEPGPITPPPRTPPPAPQREAAFVTSGLSITPAVVYTGDKVNISVLVANTGELSGSHQVILAIDNGVSARQNIVLAGGTSQQVTFEISKDIPGTYAVSIDNLSGSFAVKIPPKPAAFSLGALTVSPAETYIGQNIAISTELSNTGDLAGDYEVVLKIDNKVVSTKQVKNLPGHDSLKLTFTVNKDIAGVYQVNVNNMSGTFTMQKLNFDIAAMTYVVAPGDNVTLAASTAPGAYCIITVYTTSGGSISVAPKTADANGFISWTFRTDKEIDAGFWWIAIDASFGGDSIRESTYFKIVY